MDAKKSPFTDENLKLVKFKIECQKANLAEIDSFTVEVWLNELLETNGYSRSAFDFGEAHSRLIRKVHHVFNAIIFEVITKEQINRFV